MLVSASELAVNQLTADRACQKCDLKRADLRSMDLHWADLRVEGVSLKGVSFARADISGTNL
ncbi:MAG: pentapeptide repeat-containing protein [Candidatus Thiodiazotropha sp. (ex Lucinoma aequizonata)]|nr:pentapeptide repeat-containing protein [Candidatus Thiodiazotropha sp. (ex Lucinoma aequizonata)]MCU7896355.1 pentapeptide repeat-containing protein [Candidatus Thiodiazotropha sp. (ex Lucinoma aequizonata)]